jgi:hypothetical protein
MRFLIVLLALSGPAFAQEKTCADVSCPAQNGEFALHLPHPSDCTKFCKCDWGQAFEFSCPGDLHFNDAMQVCDWPERAQCKVEDKK